MTLRRQESLHDLYQFRDVCVHYYEPNSRGISWGYVASGGETHYEGLRLSLEETKTEEEYSEDLSHGHYRFLSLRVYVYFYKGRKSKGIVT